MVKMKKIIITLMFLVLIVGTLSFIVNANNIRTESLVSFNRPAEQLDGIFITDEGKIPNWEEIKLIKEIAYKVSTGREYHLHNYDCTQFSIALVRELKKEGFKAQCTAGSNYDFEYSDHTWVSVFLDGERIEVEATEGYIIDEEDYKSYEVKWEDRCW